MATTPTPTLYKLTAPDGRPVHGGTGLWPLPSDTEPGAWREVRGTLRPCDNGLHLFAAPALLRWAQVGGVIWLAEVDPRTQLLEDGDKWVARRVRLVRRVATLERRTLVGLAADFAEHVVHLYEDKYPTDHRPRRAIEAARQAASAAALASAADAAAADAAAASAAASDGRAARERERAWQSARVIEVLGLES